MTIVTSTLALLCITLISSAFAAGCEGEECKRFCVPNADCLSLNDCGMSKSCSQTCARRTCNEMRCAVDEKCEQKCFDCKSKMVCSSPTCEQSCSGVSCEMECTSSVDTCKQTCNEGSKCKISCDKSSTNCRLGCNGANCTGTAVPKVTKVKNDCDERTKICTRKCTGDCKGKTLSCGGDKYDECDLSCEDGCKMECDSTVKSCNQTCHGGAKCTSVCDAGNCLIVGEFRTSSAKACQLNYLMFGLFACMMLFHVKHV